VDIAWLEIDSEDIAVIQPKTKIVRSVLKTQKENLYKLPKMYVKIIAKYV
jgi:hypothetical protein